MKYFFTLLWLFTGVLAANAQQVAMVKGRITAPSADSISINQYQNLLNMAQVRQAAKVTNGAFQLQVSLAEPKIVFLRYGAEIIELYLKPGDNLELSFNTEKVDETLKFKGTGAAENTILAKLSSNYQDDDDFHNSDKNIFVDEKAYLKLVNNKFAQQEEYVKKQAAKTPVSSTFYNWLLTELKYESGVQKLNYPKIRAAAAKIADPYALSSSYYDFLNTLDLHKSEYSKNLSYLNFLQELVEYRHRSISTDPRKPDFYQTQYNLAKELLQGEARAIVCGRILMQGIIKGPIAISNAMLIDYASMPNANAYLQLVQQAYEYHKPLARGSKMPPLKLVDAKGKAIDLSVLNGKITYLYFYSLGCGSCQMEFSYAKPLATQFEDDSVTYVFVSVDQNLGLWKKSLLHKPMPGITGQTLDSAATVQLYKLSAYPAAFIIDDEGLIANGRASRLSGSLLADELKEVLKEYKNKPKKPVALPNQPNKNAPATPPKKSAPRKN